METNLSADDIRILHLLQHDAKLTNKEIADKLGKSVTPVYERIKKLEEEGFIRRYVAILDKRMIKMSLIAYAHVQLKEHSQAMLRSFEKEAIKFYEVMECYHMTGQFDYLLKVVIRDMDAYHDFMMHKLATLPNIGVVQTFFVMSEAKQETAYPLQQQENKEERKKRKPAPRSSGRPRL